MREVLTDPGLRSVAWFTLWQAAASTLLTLAVGLLPAYVLARFRFPGRAIVLALVTVPFVLPTVVVGAAFLALLPPSLDQTVAAILAAHVYFNLAVVIRTVGTLWAQLDPRLEEAARTLGASPLQVMRRVTLPLAPPGHRGRGLDHVPVHASPRSVSIRILGGPRHVTLEVEIWRLTTQAFQLPTAAALAFLQLLAVTALMVWWSGAQRRQAVTLRLRPRGTAAVPRTSGQRFLVGATVAGSGRGGRGAPQPARRRLVHTGRRVRLGGVAGAGSRRGRRAGQPARGRPPGRRDHVPALRRHRHGPRGPDRRRGGVRHRLLPPTERTCSMPA